MSHELLIQAQQVYRQALPHLFKRRNVVACGLGYKIRGVEHTEELSVVVSVVKKLPKGQLASHDLVPQAVDGLPTDVIETGHLRAFMPPFDPKARHRPAMPGISIGHYRITAGTFGLLVRRGTDLFILSNNHVLANVNDARVGDPILQPGALDGGGDEDRLATLADFEPLDFGEAEPECNIVQTLTELLNALANLSGSSHRVQAIRQSSGDNLMDAALAKPDDPAQVLPEIPELGRPVGVGTPVLGQRVQKYGRTTGYTEGLIQQVDVTANVDYNGRLVRFTDQIITSSMSKPGDSGSGILDMDKNAVGLLFAGSEQVTLFTPLQRILERFDVEVIT